MAIHNILVQLCHFCGHYITLLTSLNNVSKWATRCKVYVLLCATLSEGTEMDDRQHQIQQILHQATASSASNWMQTQTSPHLLGNCLHACVEVVLLDLPLNRRQILPDFCVYLSLLLCPMFIKTHLQ